VGRGRQPLPARRERFGLELSATISRWFVSVQPLAVDFRYWIWGGGESVTGFSRVFPLRVAVGHEF
jgi:hypothetical protein